APVWYGPQSSAHVTRRPSAARGPDGTLLRAPPPSRLGSSTTWSVSDRRRRGNWGGDRGRAVGAAGEPGGLLPAAGPCAAGARQPRAGERHLGAGVHL